MNDMDGSSEVYFLAELRKTSNTCTQHKYLSPMQNSWQQIS